MTQLYLAVFLGGGIGSVVRFSFSKWISSGFEQINPLATLASNTAASLVLGIWVYIALHKLQLPPYWKAFWVTGFCGGFSTFSTFSFETFELFKLGYINYAIANVLVSVLLAVLIIALLAYSQR